MSFKKTLTSYKSPDKAQEQTSDGKHPVETLDQVQPGLPPNSIQDVVDLDDV